MKTLCIVPCGNKKIWAKSPNIGPMMAQYAYTGSFSRKCQEYAKTFYPGNWCILSAKYGFLFPSDIIEGPYNVSFNNVKTNPISLESLSSQVEGKDLGEYERIIVLGGKSYVEIAKSLFLNKEICVPLSDCKGIGYMMGKLNSAIKGKKT